MTEEYCTRLLTEINSLTIYKKITEDKVVKIIKSLCSLRDKENDIARLIHILVTNAEEKGFKGNLLRNHIINLFLTDENIFSLYCENNKQVKGTSLYNLALSDLKIMLDVANFDISMFAGKNSDLILNYIPVNKSENDLMDYLNCMSSAENLLDMFISYYNRTGCGNISLYKVFKFDRKKGLKGIKNPDPSTFDDIIGYEEQRKTLINNTEAFMKGYQANNVLLVGARGTGKSTSVKALANKYYEDGLRIIEITKEQIIDIPQLLSMLKKRGHRFIIFIDDLSFDEQEIQYKYMKSLLEGGAESKPENVLYYATSNRRHLIQEKWSDRQRGSDEAEIHTQDTMNEKLSLADRFGITITFPKPTPQQYISIVKGLAKRSKLNIPDDMLEKEAMKWEISQKGMSGRTAKQFITNMLWEISGDR